ncbi:MAG: hypothetical protein WDA25_03370 [Paracoccaceae bacterium]
MITNWKPDPMMNLIKTIATAAVLAAVAIPAAAQNRVVTIENKSGYIITELYGSNTGATDWEEDILGADVLLNGGSIDIDYDDGTGACMFDFLAVFEDGDEVMAEDVDVCKISTFTFE